MLYYWSCFSHNQADNEVLRRTTQVTFLVSWTEMAFSRAGVTKSHRPHQGCPLRGGGENSLRRVPPPAFVLSRGEALKKKKSCFPKSVFQLARLIQSNYGRWLKKKPFWLLGIQSEKGKLVSLSRSGCALKNRINTKINPLLHPRFLSTFSCHVIGFLKEM